MENPAWWLYLCSVSGGVYTIALATFIVCLSIFIIVYVGYCNDDCEIEVAKNCGSILVSLE